MSRRKRGLDVHGVILLDKPVGISSNRALQRVRGIFKARKAGHTGSLDPFATGMLPICLGEASKTAAFMLEASKKYRATAYFGKATTTGDIEGDVIQECVLAGLDEKVISQVLNQFVGEIEQVPPMYSALKHDGKPLYEYARAGIEIDRPARPVTIHSIALLDWQSPVLNFEVHCSKGTYIRTLAEDIAKALGSCAHLVALRRLEVESFAGFPMQSLEQLQQALDEGRLHDCLLPVDVGLANWPRVTISEEQQGKFMHGNRFEYSVEDSISGKEIPACAGMTERLDQGMTERLDQGVTERLDQGTTECLDQGMTIVYGPDDNLLGLAELTVDGVLKPAKVFNL